MTSSVVLPISQPRQPGRQKPTRGRFWASDELELCADIDAAADALGDRAAARMERMRSLRRLALVLRAAGEVISNMDALDHQPLVLDEHDTLGIGGQLALAGVDPARLQRATKGAGESTGRCGDNVVKRGGVIRVLAGSGAVVLAHLVVGSEHDGLRFQGQVRSANWTSLANDPYPRDVFRVVHGDQNTWTSTRAFAA